MTTDSFVPHQPNPKYDATQGVPATPEILSPSSVMTSQNLIIASLAFAVLLFALFFVFTKKRFASRGNYLLLLGPSDAGKTAILSTVRFLPLWGDGSLIPPKLVYKYTLPTHTSMQTNLAEVTLPNAQKTIRTIDVPGHPRIRDQFKDYLPEAKAVAFVVDASTVSRNGAAVAEHLHHVLHALTSLPPSQIPPALAIIAHKSDLLKSSATASAQQLAINRVRTILERELEKRRTSQVGGVGVESLGSEGEEGSSELGGLECSGTGEFKFDKWDGGEVVFLGTHSVSNGNEKAAQSTEEKSSDSGLSPLLEWLEELA